MHSSGRGRCGRQAMDRMLYLSVLDSGMVGVTCCFQIVALSPSAQDQHIIPEARGGNFYSFIQAVSIAPLQVHYYSEALPTTALILCQS